MNPPVTLTPEQADAFGRELDAVRDRVLADLGQVDVDYIRQGHQGPAAHGGGRSRPAGRRHPAAGLAGGDRAAGVVEDPRQHGDRAQHHARPVRVDRRPGAVGPGLRMGHRVPGRPVAALPQLLPPHLHQHPRDGPRHRIRNPADEPRSTVAPLLPGQPGVRLPAHGAVPVRRRRARAGERTHSRGRDLAGRQAGGAPGDLGQDAPPTRQGLRRLPAAGRADGAVRLHRQPLGQPDPQHLVVRHHLLRPLPGRHFGIHRRGDPQRVPWTVVLPADPRLGQPDRGQAVPRPVREPLVPDRTPPVPRSAARRYAEIAPQVREICARYGIAYNSGPLPKQFATVVRKVIRLALPPRRTAERPAEAARAA